MKNHHKGHPIHPPTSKAPAPDDIARRARELWDERGQPQGQDDAIWLEAEQQLGAVTSGAPADPKLPVSF